MRRVVMSVITDLIPVRGVPFALIYCSIWLATLAATDYPVADWVGVVVIAYLVIWATLAVVLRGTVAALKWLHGYALHVRSQMGDKTPTSVALGPVGNTIVVVLFVATLLVPFGLALVLTSWTLSLSGFPPLLVIVPVAGILMVSFGASLTLTFYGLTAWLLVSTSRRLRRRTDHVVIRDRAVPRDIVNQLSLQRRRPFREQVREEYERLRELIQYNLPLIGWARS